VNSSDFFFLLIGAAAALAWEIVSRHFRHVRELR
jgi:hypothetical protein